jgi:hypothetical protein
MPLAAIPASLLESDAHLSIGGAQPEESTESTSGAQLASE